QERHGIRVSHPCPLTLTRSAPTSSLPLLYLAVIARVRLRSRLRLAPHEALTEPTRRSGGESTAGRGLGTACIPVGAIALPGQRFGVPPGPVHGISAPVAELRAYSLRHDPPPGTPVVRMGIQKDAAVTGSQRLGEGDAR